MLQIVLVLLPGVGLAESVQGANCRFPVEHAIVASVLNLDQAQTAILIQALDDGSALIPSKVFYSGLATWYQGHQSQLRSTKKQGIEQLRLALDSLKKKYEQEPSLQNRLALGVASGHIARILFEDRQYLDGFRTAMAARKLIDGYLLRATVEQPGYADALLLKGLFEIYTYDLRNRGVWLPASFKYQGNRSTGIGYIERAILNSAVFSLEGVRSLLGEVTWQTPAFCGYMTLIDEVGQLLENNSDIAVLRQGLLLKCGFTEQALEVNESYLENKIHHEPMRSQLRRAQLRIHASLGDLNWLLASKPEQEMQYHYQLALANAYDVAGQRQLAIGIYKQLSSDLNADLSIRSVAEVRQKFPFRSPVKVKIPQLTLDASNRCAAE